MDFQHYQDHFQEILSNPNAPAPYNNIDYLDYAKLNWTRQQRWLKTGVVDAALAETITCIRNPQQWIVIAEPWCGDAAHIVPFIHKLSTLNTLIQVTYQLRDTEPFLIDQYLTNGNKAIPKLIIRDQDGKDLVVWGPRPVQCQAMASELSAAKVDLTTLKTELQKWYNQDGGQSFQAELRDALNRIL